MDPLHVEGPPPPQREVQRDPKSVAKLAVTVHRATNLEVGAVTWSLPWIAVMLGSSSRQSRVCSVADGAAEFGWSTELRYTGTESHLSFAVHTSDSEVIGLCAVPVADVLRLPVLRKALPLLRNGVARRGFGSDDKLSELFVSVTCVAADSSGGGGSEGVDRNRAAKELWNRCSQVRVSVKAMQLESACLSDKPANHRPYVFARMGIQEYKTVTARRVTRREAEEFVYCYPRKGCDALCASDRYEGVPWAPPVGSAAVPAYRKAANGAVHVTYRDVSFVFWLAQQSLLYLDVLDDRTFGRDRLLASGSLDFVDLYQHLMQSGTAAQFGLGGKTHLGSLEVSLLSKSRDVSENMNEPAGSLEIEVEFLREPLALPSQLEGVFRGLNSIVRQRSEQHVEVLRDVEAMLAGDRRSGAVSSIASLPDSVRSAFASVLTTVAIADTRNTLSHEDDSTIAADNLTNAVQLLAHVLEVPQQLAAQLLASAQSMTCTGTLREAASTYRRCCSEHRQSELLPFSRILEELLRRFGGYSAKVYTTLLHTGSAVLSDKSEARMFVEVVERRLVIAVQDGAAPTIPQLQQGSQVYEALTRQARDLAEEECQRLHPAVEVRSSFLPSVDCKRLMASQRTHPGDTYLLMREYEHRVFYGAAASGIFAGALGGISTIALAKMLERLEQNIICGKDVVDFYEWRQATCRLLQRHTWDDAVVDVVGSSLGFAAFAFLYLAMYGSEAYNRLYTRYSAIKELALEPLGPPHSFHAVICASGFLTSPYDIFKPWEVDPECPWTSGQVLAVRYETGLLLRFGYELVDVLAWATKSTYTATTGFLYCSNPVSMSCWALDWLMAEFDDILDVACSRAEQAGRCLAQQLVQSYAGYGRPVRPVSLIAYSAGAKMIQACLQELRSLYDEGEAPVAANLVCDVVLFGAPCSADDVKMWTSLRHMVSGRFVNGYLSSDMTLLSYKTRRFMRNMLGTEGLAGVPGVQNMSMKSFVTKHVDYAQQMPAILAHVMRG